MRGFRLSKGLAGLSLLLLLLATFLTTLEGPALAGASHVDGLAVDGGSVSSPAKVDKSLIGASGPTVVVVQLKSNPAVLYKGSDLAGYRASLKAEQDVAVKTAAKYGASPAARLDTVLNAVIFRVDASQVVALSQELNAKSVKPVGTYQMQDDDVNQYIGATEVQQTPYNLRGQGLKVAVLDSGVDYTHASLGGPGTPAFYTQCYAQATVAPTGDCANYFGPTAPKVIGGYDFVGENWPNTVEQPDPNPIDFEGHGTHVSDIIAGSKGVAPDAKVIAIRVCSAVSTSCSGIAILEGIEYAVQQHADVMNLSLGGTYGQQEDVSGDALNNAARAGVVIAVAAGNSGDKPYVMSSEAGAEGVIGVAQTAVPSDKLYPIKYAGGQVNNVVLLSWSPPFTSSISAPVQWGVGTDKLACNPYPAGSLAGKVALIDRGACAASIKAANASAAGAVAVVIANNVPKAGPYPFSYGGGNVTAPSFAIGYEGGLKLRAVVGQTVTIDSAGFSAVDTIVSTSSRGPFISANIIKPDIGAPGASVSADVGTGTGTSAFGGTSGATPVIAGSALLLRQKYPSFNPSQIKSLLMNTADTNNKTIGFDDSIYATPITRIGAGEVRVNAAVKSGLLAYTNETVNTSTGPATFGVGSLSYGYQAINNNVKIVNKTVHVTNLTGQGRLYKFTPTFRDSADQATGAVKFYGPTQFWLNGNSSQDITIQMQIDGPKLRPWNLNAGTGGNDGSTINELEYDGYIVLDGGPNNTAKLAWQVFPHRVADTRVVGINNTYYNGPAKALQLANDLGGPTRGNADVFNLLASNGPQPTPAPGPGSNDVKIDLKAFGVADYGDVLGLAVTTYGERPTPVSPAEFNFYFDTNNDGVADYRVFNREQGYFTGGGGSFGTDGRVLVGVQKLSGTTANAYFYADVTYNSANMILDVPKAALGLTNGQTVGVQLQAVDLYFTGAVKDSLPGSGATPSGFAKFKVGSPRYTLKPLPWTNANTLSADGLSLSVPVNGTQVQLVDNGAATGDYKGLLLLYRDGAPGREADLVQP